jgi:hypothetical protein
LLGRFWQRPYFPYPFYAGLRCHRFPWLPRWWWTSRNNLFTPDLPYGISSMSREQEKDWLTFQRRYLEQIIAQLQQRLTLLQKGN